MSSGSVVYDFPCIQYVQCNTYISTIVHCMVYCVIYDIFHITYAMSETIFKSLPNSTFHFLASISWLTESFHLQVDALIISSPVRCTLWLTFTVFSGPDLGTGAEVPAMGVGAGPTMFTRGVQALIGVYKQRNKKMAYITCTLKKFKVVWDICQYIFHKKNMF